MTLYGFAWHQKRESNCRARYQSAPSVISAVIVVIAAVIAVRIIAAITTMTAAITIFKTKSAKDCHC